jgi:RHS repeat-associated protein
VTCVPSDQCHLGVCDPGSGACTNPAAPDGTTCNDGNACTQTDTCQGGNCSGGNPKTCGADQCHQAGACDSTSGTCGDPTQIDKIGCDVFLVSSGVVDMGGGNLIALFGYDGTAQGSIHPTTTNKVFLDNVEVTNPQPTPPAYLLPGSHIGSFLMPFTSGHSISWTVDTQTVSASSTSPTFTPTPLGTSGQQVDIGSGVPIVITPDMDQYKSVPAAPVPAPEPTPGAAFKGMLTGSLNIGPTGAAVYTVPISIPPGIAGMAPNLNLVYNSQGGPGIAGLGWDMTGLSVIQRCSKTAVGDGYAKAVAMDGAALELASGDGVCLDGKRLFANQPVGGYAESFVSEFADFSTITMSYDAPGSSNTTFTVVTKSGETRYYGSRTNSRVYFPREDQSGNFLSDKVTAVWALDKVVDVWGNFYEIHYNDDSSDFAVRGLIPTKIDYTGHMDVATSDIDVQPFNHVTFTYTDRKDVRNFRFRDSILPRTKLLSTITMSTGQVYGFNYYAPGVSLTNYAMDPDTLSVISFAPPNDANDCLHPFSQVSTTLKPECVQPLVFHWDRFDPATSTNGWWQETPAYALPADFSGAGTQFVDLNGDGRVDFVQAKKGSSTNGVWFNNGHGWDKMDSWALPPNVYLADTDGTALGTLFIDVDGDGLPDLITDNRYSDPNSSPPACSPGCGPYPYSCPPTCATCCGSPVPTVWLNGTRAGLTPGSNIWQVQIGALAGSNMVSNTGFFDFTTGAQHLLIGDLDGDGHPELVHLPENCGQGGCGLYNMEINSTNGQTWQHSTINFALQDDYLDFILRDVNQDGFADLVSSDGKVIYFNNGYNGNGDFTGVWTRATYNGVDQKYLIATGDLDGDGRYDQVFVSTTEFSSTAVPVGLHPTGLNPTTVSLNSGTGVASGGIQSYVDALNTYSFLPQNSLGGGTDTFWNGMLGSSEAGRYQLADLNGDGLADIVVNHAWGGALLLNQNSTFQDPGGISVFPPWRLGDLPSNGQTFVDSVPTDSGKKKWIVPTALFSASIVPIQGDKSTYPLDYFVDIDGDGIVDRVQSLMQCDPSKSSACTTPYVKKTYLNKYHPPVIREFPNGLAQNTTATYTVITGSDADNYYDTAVRESGTRYWATPLRVVKSLSADNGIGSTATTSYDYVSLRASTSGHGSLGFKEVLVTDPLGYFTDTTYSQNYPYAGRPTKVDRTKEGIGLVSETVTTYNDVQNATRSIFIYPQTVTDTSNLYGPTSAVGGNVVVDQVTTTTEYAYDSYGNPYSTTVTTTRGANATCGGGGADAGASGGNAPSSGSCESYRRQIVNHFATTAEQKRGKVTETVVTTTKLAPQDPGGNVAITHTTDFEYRQDTTLSLSKKTVEPYSTEAGIRVDTAYKYDQFGNVIATASCASDFDHCDTDASRTDYPGFRITTVSYKPIDFTPGTGAPRTSLLYAEEGRFPVKTTNAAGQVEYSAYDPGLGMLLQSTGPNGIHTCYTYDDLGWKTSQTDRCGSTAPLTATMNRYPWDSQGHGWAKLMTVSHPPSGATSWVFTDGLGRTVETLGHSFSGSFSGTFTEYDDFGRTKRTSKPFITGDPTTYWNTPSYDGLDRVFQVTQDLGSIDGTGTAGGSAPASSVQTTDYEGFSTTASTTVNGQTRTRKEVKNVLGKVASVTDANGVSISYTYDAEGNLTDTLDPAGNTVHIEYDARGRKKLSKDPDLGKWTYTYDGFGDLLTQTDAKSQTTTMTYDVLGRMTTKADSAGTATWVYDVAAGAGIGKLAAVIGAPDSVLTTPCEPPSTVPSTVVTSGNRAMRWSTYDTLGQLTESSECADGNTFTTQYDYDSAGRQSAIRYPEVLSSRFSVKYNYTSLGFLQYISDASDDKVYWEAKSMNAAGQVTDEQTRNGVETVSTRNPSTGWLLGQTVTSHADDENVVQDLKLKFDEAGNLRTRMRSEPRDMADSTETFGYDLLDRLTSAEVKVPTEGYDDPESFAYDTLGIGNLTQKSGKTYTYGGCGAGPHAVCTVGGGTAYAYDLNGNMTAGNDRTVNYNGSNKVTRISHATGAADSGNADVVAFAYGADGNRVVQSVGTTTSAGSTDITESARTIYVGLGGTGKSIYERTTRGSTIEHVHFIYAGGAHGGNAFALRVVTEDSSAAGQLSSTNSVAMKYNHFDHLGSVTATSDDMGKVVGLAWGGTNATAMGYDAWGAQRSPDGKAAAPNTSYPLPVGHRQFTGHEAIPNVGLVNMNGRVYDPELGRFLSPDPNVQFAADLQSYNRYTYSANNPLRYTDPTGYSWYSFLSSPMFWVDVVVAVVSIVGCAYTVGALCVAWGVSLIAENSVMALSMGASWKQVVTSDVISIGAMLVGGAVGGAFSGGDSGMAGSVLGGAIAGAVTAGITTPLLGGNLGQNLLMGVAMGALGGAVQSSLQGTNPVSQAAEEQQGGGAGSSGQDRSPFPFSSRPSSSSGSVYVTNDNGDIVGRVDVLAYKGYANSGVEIRLGYQSAEQVSTDLNWFQTVDANGRQFVDADSGSPNGYYMRPDTAARVEGLNGYNTQFYDTPHRVDYGYVGGNLQTAPTPNVQWSAETSLVMAGRSDPLVTFSWGFSTNAAGALSIQPLVVTSPSPYHLGAIP